VRGHACAQVRLYGLDGVCSVLFLCPEGLNRDTIVTSTCTTYLSYHILIFLGAVVVGHSVTARGSLKA